MSGPVNFEPYKLLSPNKKHNLQFWDEFQKLYKQFFTFFRPSKKSSGSPSKQWENIKMNMNYLTKDIKRKINEMTKILFLRSEKNLQESSHKINIPSSFFVNSNIVFSSLQFLLNSIERSLIRFFIVLISFCFCSSKCKPVVEMNKIINILIKNYFMKFRKSTWHNPCWSLFTSKNAIKNRLDHHVLYEFSKILYDYFNTFQANVSM